MNGTTATIALGGANRHKQESRLMKLAVVAAGRWFVGERKVSRCRRTRDRYLVCKRFASRRA